MKSIWFTTISILALVFVAPAILALTLKIIPEGEQPGYDSNMRLAIYGKRGFTQKFISSRKNLTAVGTSIRNPNLNNKKEIILNLYDVNKKLIRTALLNGRNVRDGDFIKFTFEPIPDSITKTYTFTIYSPDAGPTDTIEIFYMNSPIKNIIEYTYDGKTYPGGVPLVTFYKPDSKWQTVREIYANLFSRLLYLDSQK